MRSAVQARTGSKFKGRADPLEHRRAVPDTVFPPDHFSIVETNFFRSAIPTRTSFPFIKQLRLKSLIILSPDAPTRLVSTFCDENNISLYPMGMRDWQPTSSGRPMPDELVKEAIELVLDAQYHPLLVCDSTGIQDVGMFVGCLRKLQNWNLNSVVNEYRRFAGAKTRYMNEQFIELYDTDLVVVIEHKAPQWFRDQKRLDDEDQQTYDRLSQSNQYLSDGSVARPTHTTEPTYLTYYFSRSASPLTSDPKTKVPRIQCYPPRSPLHHNITSSPAQ